MFKEQVTKNIRIKENVFFCLNLLNIAPENQDVLITIRKNNVQLENI
jgi:hypothetical protein